MAKNILLSVTLATYNEEANIERCLKAVKDIADEIIIVDGSSTDKTREISKRLGATVIKTTNKPIFHINKEMANKKAKGKWILQLDADEFVTPSLAKEINKVVQGDYFGYQDWQAKLPWVEEAQPPVAFWIKRQNYFLGKPLRKTGQYPDPAIRLFKKGKAYLPAKDVHEFMKVEGPVAYLKENMDHVASPTFSRYLARENRYSSLTAQELKDQGIPINIFSFINFMILKPCTTFLLIYFRHKGFMDGFPGFVFSLFSALHFPLSYIKLWDLKRSRRSINISSDWN